MWKLKLDANGHVVLQDGKPVYILENGQEIAHDAEGSANKIAALNGEARAHREAKEAAETKLTTYAGIEDPEAARKALETVANLASGELTTAAKVQEIKDAAARTANEAVATATRQAEATINELKAKSDKLQGTLNETIIGSSFNGSPYIKDKLLIPPDMARSFFGGRFTVEEGGKLVPKDGSGNPIYSVTRHGEVADFEEAIATMVAQYPQKDLILKGTGQSGSGSGPGRPGGTKVDPNLSPAERMTQARLANSPGGQR